MIDINYFFKKSRILIIDDLPIGLAPLTLILEKEGHEVIFYENTYNVLEVVKEIEPDLIILDVILPQMSGIEICRELKMFPHTQKIPVLFITAKEDRETELEALRVGGADYITKPIHPIVAKERIYIHLKISYLQKELYKLSETDALTGLFNRRHLMETLEWEWNLGELSQSNIALILMDIDHFKAYNDYYGHGEGDECLKCVSDTIREALLSSMSEGYIFGRYGGEEFMLLIPEASFEQLEEISQIILDRVRSMKLPHLKSPTSSYVSISLGGGCLMPQSGISKEILFKQVDDNLYLSKRKGRDCFTITRVLSPLLPDSLMQEKVISP
jgi:diguanylate cyclase (GGDEF)-like protein